MWSTRTCTSFWVMIPGGLTGACCHNMTMALGERKNSHNFGLPLFLKIASFPTSDTNHNPNPRILQVFSQNLLAVNPGLTANCNNWIPLHRAHIQTHGHYHISCTKPLYLRLLYAILDSLMTWLSYRPSWITLLSSSSSNIRLTILSQDSAFLTQTRLLCS